MYYTPLQPIKQIPFLISSLVMTFLKDGELATFNMSALISRFSKTSSIHCNELIFLLESSDIKYHFIQLTAMILTFILGCEVHQIGPYMIHAFPKIRPAQYILNKYIASIKIQSSIDGKNYYVVLSSDRQQTNSTRAK